MANTDDVLATAQSWGRRISSCLSLIICILLLLRSRKNYHRHYDGNARLPPLALVVWSAITFSWCISATFVFLATTIPLICNILFPLGPCALVYPHIFISFYRLAQLQVIGNTIHSRVDQPHTRCSPPSTNIFIVLYIWGVFVAFYLAIISFALKDDVLIDQLPRNNGCTVHEFSAKWQFFAGIAAFWMLTWDSLIVSLYVCNISRLSRMIQRTAANMSLLQKLNAALNKVIFLSVVAEIVGVSVVASMMAGPPLDRWSGAIGLAADVTTTFAVLYLMLEHNEDDYLHLVSFAKRVGCLRYCCCCFGDLEYRHHVSWNEEMRDNHDNVTVVALRNNKQEECQEAYELTTLNECASVE